MSHRAFFHEGELVGVQTAQPLDRVLDYKAPEGGCFEGAFVEVPLGPRKVIGVVWGPGRGDWDIAKVRSVLRVLDAAPMRAKMKDFLERAGAYTLTPMSQMLRLASRAPGLGDTPAMRKIYRLGQGTLDRKTPARTRVLEVLENYGGLSFTLGELAEQAGVSTSVVKGLVKLGCVREEDSPKDMPFGVLDPGLPSKPLTEEQSHAAEMILTKDGYGTTLLQGVTGSGKTEVYLEAVANALRQNQQVLVMLPEIALTSEFLNRIEARFGGKAAEWHSGVSITERRRVWRMVAENNAQVVVGARSALFLPFQNLKLIVVDEEHDSSYKQEDGVLYNARDMAVLRASIEQAHVILASATPSLESWSNAKAGKYQKAVLTSRFGGAQMPKLEAIDMRQDSLPSGRWISSQLQAEMVARLHAGEQSMIFLNRRGYAPVTQCRACGHQMACHQCDARMVEHRFLKRMMCHQCGETEPIPQKCPNCEAEDRMAAIGPGVERMGEEVSTLFPEARVSVLSSDMFGTTRELKSQIEEIADGAADIVIGTQLVAKGHNFPNLTLVGVIDADLGLHGADLRAAERTFQLMQQVAGRAGRKEKPGLALMQTYQPEHPVIRAILGGDQDSFWQAEADAREQAGMPPFGRLAGIILSGTNSQEVFDLGNALARSDGPIRAAGAEVFGPAPAPIARVRGRHRVRLLVKAPKGVALQAAIGQWVANVSLKRDLRMSIDIDPQSFF